MIPQTIKQLCTPALAYLILASISFISLLAQNGTNSSQFCMGTQKCDVPHVSLVFVAKALYIAFWVWALNALCKAGHSKIAWAIFFLPLIFFFIAASVLIGVVALQPHN